VRSWYPRQSGLRRPTIAGLANTMGLAAPARGSEMTDLLPSVPGLPDWRR
jgi:hypothetical protein